MPLACSCNPSEVIADLSHCQQAHPPASSLSGVLVMYETLVIKIQLAQAPYLLLNIRVLVKSPRSGKGTA